MQELRDAFDSDDVPRKNIALRHAYDRIADLEEALRAIAANTYGTELCNTAEENLYIVSRHLSRHQQIARDALAKDKTE